MDKIQYEVADKDVGFENVKNVNFRTLLFSYPCNSNFNCTPYNVVLSPGIYQIECYGAGNTHNGNSAGGGYTSGIINVKEPLEIYLYLGAEGEYLYNDFDSNDEVFNGGGGNLWAGHTGSGATDFRLVNGSWKNFDSLKSRIMVAGGAGGSECGKGGFGGGLKGGDGESGKCDDKEYKLPGAGASNNDGGDGAFPGEFGYATKPISGSNGEKNYNCGGGGYYGGGSNKDTGAGGGGGSSFISGHRGCDAIHKDSTALSIQHTEQSIHYSNISFFSTTILSGNENFISPDHLTIEKGHVSSGSVVITILSPHFITSKCKSILSKHLLFIISLLSS